MLSLAHPFVLQSKTVRQRQRERQHLTVVATLGPPCLLYTLRVWMRGATGPRRCRTSVFVFPARCKVAIVASRACKLVVLSISALIEHSSKSC
jgi:hypothetical protein